MAGEGGAQPIDEGPRLHHVHLVPEAVELERGARGHEGDVDALAVRRQGLARDGRVLEVHRVQREHVGGLDEKRALLLALGRAAGREDADADVPGQRDDVARTEGVEDAEAQRGQEPARALVAGAGRRVLVKEVDGRVPRQPEEAGRMQVVIVTVRQEHRAHGGQVLVHPTGAGGLAEVQVLAHEHRMKRQEPQALSRHGEAGMAEVIDPSAHGLVLPDVISGYPKRPLADGVNTGGDEGWRLCCEWWAGAEGSRRAADGAGRWAVQLAGGEAKRLSRTSCGPLRGVCRRSGLASGTAAASAARRTCLCRACRATGGACAPLPLSKWAMPPPHVRGAPAPLVVPLGLGGCSGWPRPSAPVLVTIGAVQGPNPIGGRGCLGLVRVGWFVG